jgi:hypothetical protein
MMEAKNSQITWYDVSGGKTKEWKVVNKVVEFVSGENSTDWKKKYTKNLMF